MFFYFLADSDEFFDAEEGEYDEKIGTYVQSSASGGVATIAGGGDKVRKVSATETASLASCPTHSVKDKEVKSSTDLVLDFTIHKVNSNSDITLPHPPPPQVP